jgi:hypothetical protein
MTEREDFRRQLEHDSLLYAWFKHLTTLCLLTLGGVLSLSQLTDADDLKKPLLIIVLVAVATAGVFAFFRSEAAGACPDPRLPNSKAVLFLQKSAPIIPSFGVGAFLYIFIQTMY